MTELLCKGAWALGTACGTCPRCVKTAPAYIRGLERDLAMYQNAWLRELGGRTFPKAHLIDSLVVTTRWLRQQADRFELEHLHSMDPKRYGELSDAWFKLDQS